MMRIKTRICIGVAGFAALMLSVAGPINAQEDEAAGVPVERPATNAAAVLEDLPAVESGAVAVDIRGGRAVLRGNVSTLLASEQIEAAMRTLDGILYIENDIRIYAGNRRDLDIRKDIENQLFSHPSTELFEVDVDVQRGRAILRGTVDSMEEARAAARIVKSVPGVTEFVNKLVIEVER